MTNTNTEAIKSACGGILKNPEKYPTAEYHGETVYFCAEGCLRAFEQDPERFMAREIEHPID